MVAVSGFPGELSVPEATFTWEVPPSGCDRTPEVGPLASGWVGCILTVALGRAGAIFGGSLGSVIRAVSFFGEAGLARTGAAGATAAGTAPLGGAGRSGTVGLPV